ncbi:unnamed protein product [Aspergillus niger]|uniref:Contig An13c0130, genomic contig n=1 Tax=Aspergillus niger (strain ATCC MYA-4892 / CBS 513.88 / FGSC A1513) TaxID=425011 RepID=A2R293_ASPNC|nr:unnamed protein product [Aspergillus niger]
MIQAQIPNESDMTILAFKKETFE